MPTSTRDSPPEPSAVVVKFLHPHHVRNGPLIHISPPYFAWNDAMTHSASLSLSPPAAFTAAAAQQRRSSGIHGPAVCVLARASVSCVRACACALRGAPACAAAGRGAVPGGVSRAAGRDRAGIGRGRIGAAAADARRQGPAAACAAQAGGTPLLEHPRSTRGAPAPPAPHLAAPLPPPPRPPPSRAGDERSRDLGSCDGTGARAGSGAWGRGGCGYRLALVSLCAPPRRGFNGPARPTGPARP